MKDTNVTLQKEKLPVNISKLQQDIIEYAPEIYRATQSFGKSQSQLMRTLMTFDSHTPLRNLRQILAEIEKKKSALDEARHKRSKKLLKLEKLEKIENPTQKQLLKIDKLKSSLERSELYIVAAIKEIHYMQEVYKDIKVTHNISDNWDEKEFEEEEESYHIQKAFEQGIADIVATGRLTQGNNIYFRQIGINPINAIAYIKNYISLVEKGIGENDEKSIEIHYKFLSDMVEKFKGCSLISAKHRGLEKTYKTDSLYIESKGQ